MSDKKTEKLFAKALKVTTTNRDTGNYKSALLRIQNANTTADLKKLETSFDRVYNAGYLTISEFKRLDSKIMDKVARLEAAQDNVSTKSSLGISRKALSGLFSRKHRGSAAPAALRYTGKLKASDLHELSERIQRFAKQNNTSIKALEAKYLASGFSPMRFRWDLFNAAATKPFDLVKRIYSYADDDHIDTALRHIIANAD